VATAADFDAVLAPHYRENGAGAAVAVRHKGSLIHAKGYGLANVEWGEPIDLDTVFRIGSITKQFTAAAIMKLAEEGTLGIDDPIERHLPDYPVGARRITVRHLLHHTSGIRSYTSLSAWAEQMSLDKSVAQIIDVFKDLPLDFEPGEQFLYNNSGYLLLGAIIERLSGKDYGTYLKNTFFGPLGMASTRYLSEAPITPKRAAGYQLSDRELINAMPLSMTWPHAAGALGSTVNDLLRWDEALRGGEVVSPASYAAMTTPGRLNNGEPTGYGFGLVTSEYRGRRGIGHGGGINGFVTNLAHWPDEDLTVVVLSNLVTFAVPQVSHALVRRALGLEDTQRSPVSLDRAELERCAGAYRVGPATLPFVAEAEGLRSAWPTPGSLLLPLAADTFFPQRDPEVTVTFKTLKGDAYQRVVLGGYGEPVTGERAPEPTEALEPAAG